MATTAEVAALVEEADLAVVLHEGAVAPMSSLDLDGVRSILVVVGPEGGITDEELAQLGAAHVVRMGESVLRTSTAGVAAVAALLSRTARWSSAFHRLRCPERRRREGQPVIAGRYTLEREVGRGGMGVVWLARDEVLGRLVAMKRVGMFPGGNDPDLERAAREARLAATLNHPHVVAVFDLVTDGDEQWLVMEYVDCVTLGGLVKRDGPLDPDLAARLVGQAAQALAAAHAAGIVHRDVKPANILVTAADQVKLTDFGIARAVADASLTQTGLVTGSPAYLAPEVASGQQGDQRQRHVVARRDPVPRPGRPPAVRGHREPARHALQDHQRGPAAPARRRLARPGARVDDGHRPGRPLVDGAGPRRARAGPDRDAADDPAHGRSRVVRRRRCRADAGAAPDRCSTAGGADRTTTTPRSLADAPAPAPEPRSASPPGRAPGLLALLAAVVVLALVVLLGWGLLRGDSDSPRPTSGVRVGDALAVAEPDGEEDREEAGGAPPRRR